MKTRMIGLSPAIAYSILDDLFTFRAKRKRPLTPAGLAAMVSHLLRGRMPYSRQGCPLMGRCRALMLALTLGILSGCSGERSRTSTSFFSKLRPFQASPPADSVQLDVALVQIPYSDAARYG